MPSLHPVFTDHAVVAARLPRILGSAEPGTTVTVTLAGVTVRVTTGTDGGWVAELPELPCGGPHTLVASDRSGEAIAHDVLLGEVWLGSGQSNMEYNVALTKGSEEDLAQANEPRLRVFTVAKRAEPAGPLATLAGRWQVCTPRDAGSMSAVGFYFGRRMVAETGHPFGLIISAWGGSSISSWLPEESLHARAEYGTFLVELEHARRNGPALPASTPHEDPGIAAHAQGWADPALKDHDWPSLPVPGQWQDEGWSFNGAVWYRRTAEIPSDWVGQDLELELGVVDDCDHTFINGTLVGGLGTETPNWWSTPRIHNIRGELITGTTVHLAVRVFDRWGNGGILGSPRLHRSHVLDQPPLPLHGRWRAKPEIKLEQRSPDVPPNAPASLWNAMIHPLAGVSFSGVLWYQGESDVGRARIYQRLLTDLIRTWRCALRNPDLPFGIVQLANFQQRMSEPGESPWADLREAQRRVALHTPACGLALAIDAGEADDIHPRHKRTVGERLALWALHSVHRRADLTCSGPLPAEVWSDNDSIRIRFVHADGLRIRGDALRGFQIAGADRSWTWGEARIEGDTVRVRAPRNCNPVAVRYAWQANPETTLENAAGLPASPFRTDHRPDLRSLPPTLHAPPCFLTPPQPAH